MTFDEITGLHSEEEVLVGNCDEFVITRSPSSLVSSEGKIRVAFFTIFTNDFGVIELILDEEVTGSFITRVNLNFGKGVVKSGFLDSLVVSCFKPDMEHSQFASVLEFINEVSNWANMDRVQKLLDVNFITVEVQEGSQNLGSGV